MSKSCWAVFLNGFATFSAFYDGLNAISHLQLVNRKMFSED